MKKNIKKVILLAGLVSMLTACREEHFHVLPTDQDTPETIFTRETNFRAVLDGAYDYMKNAYSSDTGNALVIGDALADNLILNPDGRQTNKIAYEWGYSAEDFAVTGLYEYNYRTISRANQVLENINKVPYTDYMKNIEAEARAIRAISHFDIARAYAKIPTQDASAPNSLGIAYVTAFDPAIKTSRDATVRESYDKILADLLFAKDNIKEDNSIGRLNKAAVLGYLSKVYLYLGQYDDAVTYGEEAIRLKPSVGSINNFSGIWNDSSQDGVLFAILNKDASTDAVNIGVGYNQNTGGIKSEYSVSYDLFQQYTANDVRKGAYLLTANFGSTPYNNVVKYRTSANTSKAGIVNVKLLRTADVYLTVAEARYKGTTQRDESRALALLNTLRAQRYTGFTAGTETGTALLDAILHERRLEMAFENDRFWTLKRLGKDVERDARYGSAVDGSGNDKPTGALQRLPNNNYRFVLPIPASAIRINPAIQQNPGGY